MFNKFSKFAFFLLLLVFCANYALAQSIAGCQYVDNLKFGNKEVEPHVKKRMVKLCIEANKKDHEKLIRNSEEVAKLSSEIEESFESNNKLSSEDQKKLKRVEKLLKQIRRELKANDDDEDEDEEKPSNTLQAIKNLQVKTNNLLSEVRKTTRHTISTAAIQTSNAVKKLVRFIRFKK